MIKEDSVAERIAIDSYGKMIRPPRQRRPHVRPMLEGILAMEEPLQARGVGARGEERRDRLRPPTIANQPAGDLRQACC